MGHSRPTERQGKPELRSQQGSSRGAVDVMGPLLLGEWHAGPQRWHSMGLRGLLARWNASVVHVRAVESRYSTTQLPAHRRHHHSMVLGALNHMCAPSPGGSAQNPAYQSVFPTTQSWNPSTRLSNLIDRCATANVSSSSLLSFRRFFFSPITSSTKPGHFV